MATVDAQRQLNAKHQQVLELERKLAEQQAAVFTVRAILSYSDAFVVGKAVAHLQKHFADNGSELNTLLAQAREDGRREAVPDGWQVVPKVPTENMVVLAHSAGWSRIDIYQAMLAAAPSHASLNAKEGGE